MHLFHLSQTNDDMSYLILMPFLVAAVVFIERRPIFRTISFDIRSGSLFALFGIAFVIGNQTAGKLLAPDLQLSVNVFALLLFLIGGFAFSFGKTALRAAHFPLLYLFLMIPLPDVLLHQVIYLLQAGSASISGALFDLFRVPVLREGFVFRLPQFSIEVAKECSGIRSSMALLILALPLVHFGLRRFWRKAVFLVCAILVMIIKNGIRIVSLTLLAMYIDPRFLFGRLHHQGGIVFFLIGLLLLLPIYLALQAGESPAPRSNALTLEQRNALSSAETGRS